MLAKKYGGNDRGPKQKLGDHAPGPDVAAPLLVPHSKFSRCMQQSNGYIALTIDLLFYVNENFLFLVMWLKHNSVVCLLSIRLSRWAGGDLDANLTNYIILYYCGQVSHHRRRPELQRPWIFFSVSANGNNFMPDDIL